MNHVYRVVWNAAIGAWVAASEFAKGHGRTVAAGRRVGGHVLAPLALALGIGLAVAPALATDYTSRVTGPHTFVDGDTVTVSSSPYGAVEGFSPFAGITSSGRLTIMTTNGVPGLEMGGEAPFTSAGIIMVGTVGYDGTRGAYGIRSYVRAPITLRDAVVTTDGANAWGLVTDLGGIIISSGLVTVDTEGTNAHGIASTTPEDAAVSSITLNNAEVTTAGQTAHGLFAGSSGTITSTGSVTVDTTGDSANGVFAESGGAVTLNNADITTVGLNTLGLFAASSGTITSSGLVTVAAEGRGAGGVASTGTGSSITLNNADIITAGFDAYGLHAVSSGTITSSGAVTINTGGDGSRGVLAIFAGSTISLMDAAVTTAGQAAFGLYAGASGGIASSGMVTISTAGQGSHGGFADGAGSTISLADANITTTGDAAFGLRAVGGGAIASTGTLAITTSGDGAHGIVQRGASSPITFAGATTSVSTSGTAAHGLVLEAGATRTFDGTTANALPTFSVSGDDAAALTASGSGSRVTLTGTAALDAAMATGAESWGVKAELGGSAYLVQNSSTGGVGLWADQGTIVLQNTADASGSRVRLIDGPGVLDGVLLVQRDSASLGSLEGDGLLQFQNPGGVLTLGSANTTGGGSLLDGADFAGTLTNVSTLTKVGTITQLLSGTGNTVDTVTVSGGTLAFAQNGGFIVTGDYTTGSGAQTTLSPSTAVLDVGGAFTQATGSTLDVTVGDAPNVIADSAVLGGRLLINGVGDTGGMGSASEVLASDGTVYTLIQTTNGITGDFEGSGSDYVLAARGVSGDGLAYQISDVRLAWIEGGATQGTGTFTVEDGMTFDIDIALGDQAVPTDGFASGWDGRSLTKAGTGTLLVSTAQDYTGSTTLEAGTLQTNAANVFANSSAMTINGGVLALNGQDQLLHQLSGTGGQVALDGATLTAELAQDTTFAGDIVDGSAAGQLTKSGAGVLTLGGLTDWTGGTDIAAGTLVLDGTAGGAQLAGPVGGTAGTLLSLRNGAQLTGVADTVDVRLAASMWQLTGDSTIGAFALGDGTVAFDHGDATFKTLTVARFSGNGGVLAMNTRLDGDDASSDLLHVLGDASGTARLQVTDAGGAGAQTTADGIRLVQVDGASNAAFSLDGRAVSGAYEYFLHRGGVADPNDGDWYLRSELASVDGGGSGAVLRPEVGAYLANQSAAVDLFRQDRHDRPREADLSARLQDGHVFSMWLRANSHGSSDVYSSSQLEADTDTSLLQIGTDLASWGGMLVGVMAATGRSETDVRSELTGITARGRVEGEALGVYGTWYAQPETLNGLYVDAWVQAARYRHRIAGEDLQPEKFEADATLGSVEAGYAWLLRESASHALYLEPQVQVVYTDYEADPHTEANGTQVAVGEAGGLGTRVGLRAYGHATRAGNQVQPYLQADWLHAHGDANAVSFDGLHQVGGLPKERYGLKAGLRLQLASNWSMWGEFGVQRGEGEFRDTGGQVGLRRSW